MGIEGVKGYDRIKTPVLIRILAWIQKSENRVIQSRPVHQVIHESNIPVDAGNNEFNIVVYSVNIFFDQMSPDVTVNKAARYKDTQKTHNKTENDNLVCQGDSLLYNPHKPILSPMNKINHVAKNSVYTEPLAKPGWFCRSSYGFSAYGLQNHFFQWLLFQN
jgi:hypothetical protein